MLERLDQALGRRAEDRALLRAAEPISARCDFDGPCSRLETLVTACSGLADELVGRLSARRLGVRHATLRFRHADLPADLSSDATLPVLRPGASGPSSAGSLREVAAPRTPSMPASPDGVSTIELRFSTPVFRRAHLWEVLAPRLERIALDFGVESIEGTVHETALLRVSQMRISQLDGISVDRRHRTASQWCDVEEGGAATTALARWLDLVAARGGHGGRRGPTPRFDSPSHGDRAHGDHAHADRAHRHAQLHPIPSWCEVSSAWPSQLLVPPEEAVLRLHEPGEAEAERLAEVIACRTSWCRIAASSDPTPPARAWTDRWLANQASTACGSMPVPLPTERVARPSGASALRILWRGRWRPVLALDGWEREAPAWWSAMGDDARPAGSDADEVRCRICIDPGLWGLARWPARLSDHSSDGRATPRPCVARPMREVVGTEGSVAVRRWFEACKRALESGLPLQLLGIWG